MVSAFWAKLAWSRPLLGLLGMNLFWCASFFVAPLILAPGTFAWPYSQYPSVAYHLGGANQVDYEPIWQTMWLYPRAVYTFGDLQCHQLWYRSFWINGNQMPMCERMVAMYIFANLGLVAAALTKPATSASQMIVNSMPRWVRERLVRFKPETASLLLLFLFLLPTAVDGFTQLLTPYESDPIKRVITGGLAGYFGGLLVGSMLMSMKQFTLELRAFRSGLRPTPP